jgi:hypothetical protein
MQGPDMLREQDFYAVQHLVTTVSSFRIVGEALLPVAKKARLRYDKRQNLNSAFYM